MIDRFARVQIATYKPDIRRIVTIAMLIGAIGAIWHFARPAAIRLAAQRSLGLPARTALIRSALNEIYPPLPEDPGEQYPQTFWKPSPGCATWPIDPTMKYNGGRRAFAPARHVFVDGRLEPYGLVKAEFPFISVPYADRSGRLVAAFRYNVAPALTGRISPICVIRLGPDTNEVVGIVVHRTLTTPSAIWQVHHGWRDEDGDGTLEFVLLGENLAKRTQFVTPTETLAVFRWDDEESALRMVRVPSDGSVVFWTPPAGRPYAFPQTAVIDDICRELLPLPDAFRFGPSGVAPPVPASTPSSQPATSHLSEPRP